MVVGPRRSRQFRGVVRVALDTINGGWAYAARRTFARWSPLWPVGTVWSLRPR